VRVVERLDRGLSFELGYHGVTVTAVMVSRREREREREEAEMDWRLGGWSWAAGGCHGEERGGRNGKWANEM
jgi:4-aminobutyrate aminotransferase-like enzyme